MTLIWLYSAVSVVLVSALALLGILTLSLSERVLRNLIFILVSVSVGALFGDAFIHLIPDSFQSGLASWQISLLIISGIVVFFVLEKFLKWRHSHGDIEEGAEGMSTHDHSSKHLGPMVLVSDTMHNFIDGVTIGASYLVSIEVGIATTIAIILHEIPHEIASFGLLIHSGFSRRRALLLNFVSALFAIVGTIVALTLGSASENLTALIIPFAAGNFIYIAGSDLVPELHKTNDARKSIFQFISILLGIAIMFALLALE